MIEIGLTVDEVAMAASHAMTRRAQNLRGNRGDREQRDRSTWDNEVEGACAELAFCKYRGVYWSGVSGLKARDGGFLDVRWTKHFGTGGLIMYPKDEDGGYFVLMDGFAPAFRIVGYMRGSDAKQDQWLDRGGYYLVPRNALKHYPTGV